MAKEMLKQWILASQNGPESLVSRQAPMPTNLGQHEVFVKLHAASLNYRDIAIAKVNIHYSNPDLSISKLAC
jgi:NADPH:quinone reductase-like Zn-dependent oxidoreductase